MTQKTFPKAHHDETVKNQRQRESQKQQKKKEVAITLSTIEIKNSMVQE